MQLPYCALRLQSALDLESLGRVISAKVLGGVPMGGREEFIRDEVPAIFSSSDVLGMCFVLMGEPGDEGFFLEAETTQSTEHLSSEEMRDSLVDLSPLSLIHI